MGNSQATSKSPLVHSILTIEEFVMFHRQVLSFFSLCVWLLCSGNPNIARADGVRGANDDGRARVICFGDSITKRGYSDRLSQLIGVEAINAGVGGHTSRQGLRRMQKDVLSKHPDVVVILFGTNDSRVDAPGVYVPVEDYRANLRTMITSCRDQHAKVVVCTLPPIDSEAYFARHDKKLFDAEGGLQQLIARYRDAAVLVAKQTDVPLVDLNRVLKNEPTWLSSDGVHPSEEGSAIIARYISEAVAPMVADASNTLPSNAVPSNTKPNVIMIMSDDQGWGDVGFNGNKSLHTPHLDAMAASGVRFDRFYASAPLCSPTRGSCLTGRYPFRFGILAAHTGGMRVGEITIAEMLKKQGYQTGFFGKWHMGWVKPEDAGSRGFYSPPGQHGFDESFATTSAVPTWNPTVTPADWESWGAKPGEPWKGGAPYVHNGKPVTENMDGDDSRVIMDRVIPFVESNKDAPFFATVWFHAPHEPVVAGEEYKKRYQKHGQARQNLYGCITAMDEQIGRLRQKLRALKIEKSTVVFFCSDNGPADKLTKKGVASAGSFKGHKHTMYEGGLLVPACAEWPGVIPAGKTTSIRCSTVDFFPTIANITGYKFAKKDKRPIDGIDLMPVINGTATERGADLFFGYRRLHTGVDGKAIISGDWKLMREAKQDGRLRLYNLSDDPYEQSDLVLEMPDRVETLRKKLQDLESDCQRSRDGADYRY